MISRCKQQSKNGFPANFEGNVAAVSGLVRDLQKEEIFLSERERSTIETEHTRVDLQRPNNEIIIRGVARRTKGCILRDVAMARRDDSIADKSRSTPFEETHFRHQLRVSFHVRRFRTWKDNTHRFALLLIGCILYSHPFCAPSFRFRAPLRDRIKRNCTRTHTATCACVCVHTVCPARKFKYIYRYRDRYIFQKIDLQCYVIKQRDSFSFFLFSEKLKVSSFYLLKI